MCVAGSGCEAEEDSELEDWDSGNSGRQEAWDTDAMPDAMSALEDSLLFESKINNEAQLCLFLSVQCSHQICLVLYCDCQTFVLYCRNVTCLGF